MFLGRNVNPPPSALPPDLLAAALPLLTGLRRIPMTGKSMRPTLVDGAELLVDFSVRELRAGDLVVFLQGGVPVVHRYLGRARLRDGRRCLRTRGDALLSLDPPLFPDKVLGRVERVLRGDRWRDLRVPGARAYGRALAAHDLFWAALGVLARRLDGAPGGRLWRAVRRVDRALLRRVDRLLFDRLHPAVAPPPP